MTDTQAQLLRDLISVLVVLIPVLTLFWKVAVYTAKMQQQLKEKDNVINELKSDIRSVEEKNTWYYFTLTPSS